MANLESPSSQPGHPPAVIAGFSGWLLDAFDFFLITFCLTAIAHEFHKSVAEASLLITATMVCRPLGGFLFGLLADRYGRRRPLMVNMGFFAIAGVLTGLVPSFNTLLIVRGLFGIVMGGTWGVGASLAMESAPAARRGLLSGVLQEGYAAGNVLAAVFYFFCFNRLGWRWLFILSSAPAIPLVLYIVFCVKESTVWQQSNVHTLSWAQQHREIFSHWKLFLYLLLFLTAMMFASHGTQDLYPTFLQSQRHFTPERAAVITGISAVGAIFGGLVLGGFSDRMGRRRTIIIAFVFGAALIPVWAYAPSQALLIAGAFFMQFMVQGAWGIIPAHLAELSPDSVRALLPGFAYQSAGFIASFSGYIEARYTQHTSYSAALALTAIVVFTVASFMAWVGREHRGQRFGAA
jgi:SHS family lactate transporter-like MFS transporter